MKLKKGLGRGTLRPSPLEESQLQGTGRTGVKIQIWKVCSYTHINFDLMVYCAIHLMVDIRWS